MRVYFKPVRSAFEMVVKDKKIESISLIQKWAFNPKVFITSMA